MAQREGLEAGKAESYKRARDEFKDLSEAVRHFEQESGIKIADPWRMGDVGRAVKVLADFSPAHLTDRLQGISDTARFLHESADRALKAFKAEGGN